MHHDSGPIVRHTHGGRSPPVPLVQRPTVLQPDRAGPLTPAALETDHFRQPVATKPAWNSAGLPNPRRFLRPKGFEMKRAANATVVMRERRRPFSAEQPTLRRSELLN